MTFLRSSRAALVAVLCLAAAASAQFGTRNQIAVTNAVDLGTFDWATQTFLADTLDPGDEGTTETAILSNTGSNIAGYVMGTNVEADFFYLKTPLDTAGSDALTSFSVGYVTRTFGTTTFTIRLHTGAVGAGDLGASRNFTFVDFPGSDDGTSPTAYTFDVLLRDPSGAGDDVPSYDALVLEDGPFAMSFVAGNTSTGPLWVDQSLGASAFDPEVEVYGLDAGFVIEYAFVDDEGEITLNASPYLELRTTPLRLEEGETLPPTIARGRDFRGVLDAGGEQLLRFEGLQDESVTLLVRRESGTLTPTVAVVEQATGAIVASDGSGKPRARIKTKLPSTGIYEVRIAGLDDTAGSYQVRVRNRPPRAARRPVSPTTMTMGVEPVAVFPARGLGTLDVRIKTKGDTDTNLSPPRVVGDVGELDISAYLTQDGGDFEIDDLPLPALGGYQIFGSDLSEVEEEGVTQKVRARVRFPKFKKSDTKTIAQADLDIVGDWVREDFVTDGNSSRFTFDLDRQSGRSKLEVRDGPAVTTYWIDDWTVTPIESEFPGAHTVEYVVTEVETTGADFSAFLGQGTFVEAYFHPDDDPNRIEFFAGGIGWRRATDLLPAPPELSDAMLSESASEFGLPAGLPSFVIDCTDESKWFEIYRAEAGGTRPSRPLDVIEARCTGDEGTLRYFDFSADGATSYRYWARTLDADGRRSGVSAPVDVSSDEL